MPAYEKIITRIYFFGDEIEKIVRIDNVSGEILETPDKVVIYPAVHYLSYDENTEETLDLIRQELAVRLAQLKAKTNLLKRKDLNSVSNMT